MLTDIQVALSESCIVTIVNEEGLITYVNDMYSKISNYRNDEVIGKRYNKLLFDETASEKQLEIEDKLRIGQIWSGELKSFVKSGRPLWLQTTIVPFIRSGEVPYQYIAISTDITLRKLAEEQRRDREKQLQSLINAMPDAIVFKDHEGRWLEANNATLELAGLAQTSAWQGKCTTEIENLSGVKVPQSFLRCADAEIWENRVPVHEEISVADRFIDRVVIPVYKENGEPFRLLTIARDITPRRAYERELRTLKDEFESIFNSSADAISLYDVHGKVVRVNHAFEKMYGWTNDEIVGDFLPFDDIKEETASVFEDIRTHRRQRSIEAIRHHRNGQEIRVSMTVSPILNEIGEVIAVTVIGRDVTEKHETMQMLLRSEKLSAVGQLAAGIAHELRNPMTVLRGFTQMLKTSPESATPYVDVMLREFDRVDSIIGELLTLAKPQSAHFEAVDLPQLLGEVAHLYKPQAMLKNIHIANEFEPSSIHVIAVRDQLKQVFINLIRNSIEASSEGGRIEVSTTQTDTMVKIRFTDYGHGIPEEHLLKVGEPFHTTKQNGTGLGLLITQRIISEHQGQFQIKSKVDVGTEITITLPKHNSKNGVRTTAG